MLYPKIFPLMFFKIVSYIDDYKHLMEENKFFLKMNKGVFDWHLKRMSFDWHLDKELRLGVWDPSSDMCLTSFDWVFKTLRSSFGPSASIKRWASFDQVQFARHTRPRLLQICL